MSEQEAEQGQWGSRVDIREQHVSGPEARACLAHPSSNKKASVAGVSREHSGGVRSRRAPWALEELWLWRLWCRHVRWASVCFKMVAVAAVWRTDWREEGWEQERPGRRPDGPVSRWQRWESQQVCDGLYEALGRKEEGEHGFPSIVLNSWIELPFYWDVEDLRGKKTGEKN